MTYSDKLRLCCCFICPIICPPVPSRIINKASLFPPSEQGYEVSECEQRRSHWPDSIKLSLSAFAGLDFIVDNHVEAYKLNTEYGHSLICMYIPFTKRTSTGITVLYSHSNSTDNGYMCPYLFMLSRNLRVNVLAYDYSGYGASSGKASEKNIYRNIDSVYADMLVRLKLKPNQIVVMGSSIGTCASVHLASNIKVAGVILDSAVRSGVATIMRSDDLMCGCIRPYGNVYKMNSLKAPCLMLHGKQDRVIRFEDALHLHSRIPDEFRSDPLWLSDAEHMDILRRHESYARMDEFLRKEIASAIGRRASTNDAA